MSLFECRNITFAYEGGSPVLVDATFRVSRGQKIAVVGPNGAGKSTLLKVVAGELMVDSGVAEAHGVVHRLAQEDDIEAGGDMRVDEWLDERCVEGLLDFEDVHRVLRTAGVRGSARVAQLSEGQRVKLRMTVAVLRPGVDLLLLDEPTAHLELQATLLLQELVRGVAAACLVVSHDAAFLNAVADSVFEVASDGSVRCVHARFDEFLEMRAAKVRRLEADEAARQKRAAGLSDAARKLAIAGAQGSQHQMPDRDKMLMQFRRDRAGRSLHSAGVRRRQADRALTANREELDAPPLQRPVHFPQIGQMPGPRPPLLLDDAHSIALLDAVLCYAAGPSVGPLSLSVAGGERVAIVGHNGVGKSLLLSSLAGLRPLRAGSLHRGALVRVQYLSQIAVNSNSLTAVDLLNDAAPARAVEQVSRLASCGIEYDASRRPVSSLSPGLKARLAVLLISLANASLLILDEPTNFMDIVTKQALFRFISTFSGSLIVATHDRDLLSSIDWDRILEIHQDDTISLRDINLDDYIQTPSW